MRMLLGVLTVSSICLVLSFGTTGCTPAKPKGTDKFEAEKAKETLKAKGGTVTIAFKKGEPDSVDPKDKDGVTAEIKDKKVVFTSTVEPPDADKTIKFTIKGGKDKKEEAVIEITLAKKEKPADKTPPDKTPPDKTPPDKTPSAEDLVIEGKAPTELTVDKEEKKNVTTIKFSKGKVDSATVESKEKGVTVEGKDDWIKITVAKDAKDQDVVIKVKAKGDKKGVDLPIKIKALPAAGGLLNDRQDQRFFQLPRQIATISTERFVALNRRM